MRNYVLSGLAAVALGMAACGGGGGGGSCTVGKADGCTMGMVCEADTTGGKTAGICVFPTVLNGIVSDAATSAPIAGARVQLLDADTQEAVDTTTSGADGTYSFNISLTRSDGADDQTKKNFLVYAGAKGYYPFPSRVQIALPVEVDRTDAMAKKSTVTKWDVKLIPAPAANSRQISGTVYGPDSMPMSGVLVVAYDQSNPDVGTSTISAQDGTYILFSVAQGQYNVTGYHQGIAFDVTPQNVGSQDYKVDIHASTEALGSISGSINIVATSASGTDVVLLIPSVRQVPPGLDMQVSGNSGTFKFDGVAAGVYDVVPSFANDDLVLDPSSIAQAGAPPRIMLAAGQAADAGTFKITGAVALSGGEGDQSATPTFSWNSYPSASQYAVEVRDALGQVIWGGIQNMAGEVSPVTGASNVMGGTSVTYPGTPALTPGLTYQYRVFAFKVSPQANCRCELISNSEDQRGIFTVKK
jgi:hypothetical protein